MLRDKPGYEHLNEPLHVLVEAEFPADIIDGNLNQAVSILEDLLKPIVCTLVPVCCHYVTVISIHFVDMYVLLTGSLFSGRVHGPL
jgi:hypothetical protein